MMRGKTGWDAVSDADLLLRWQGGDRTAGEKLLERHASAVVRYFTRHAPRDTEDLVQRTMLACVELGTRSDQVRSFRAYLLGIAHKLLLKHLREKKRWARWRGVAPAPAKGSSEPVDLDALEWQRGLEAGMQGLSEDLRMTLRLYYWQGCQITEIARLIGVPEGTVKTRLHRARRQLKRRLTDSALGDAPQYSRRAC